MKKQLTMIFLAMMVMSGTYANDGKKYLYSVDLTQVVNDRVKVELNAPRIKNKEIKFFLPKIIPGTYSVADYGRMASEVKAFDKKGNKLDVERIDDNSWLIKRANKLARLSYWIEDSFDSNLEGPDIFQPAGTNIEEHKNFLLNSSGVFGYFEDMKQMDFEFNVIRDKNLYGATGLIPLRVNQNLTHSLKTEGLTPNSADARVDTYSAESYDALVDSPLMYAVADTAIIDVGGTEVLISSYSPNKVITAKEIAGSIEEILMAQKEFLGGTLPVDKYAFLFYFTDGPVTSTGALEHSYSSVYYTKEQPLSQIRQYLRNVAAHEFFHIITPLNIHSEEIHAFDFNEPKMSKHLWLYEGVTEYFAGNVQVQHGINTPDQYLRVLSNKMLNSTRRFDDNLAFTEMSKHVLDRYSDQFTNVYQKGALIAMCMDIKLRVLSDGSYGMQNLMADLSKKFGKDKPFKDENLFKEITKITYPEIGEFLELHVDGNEALPFEEVLQLVGITYKREEPYMAYSLGLNDATVGFDAERNKLKIVNEERLNAFGKALGFKNGDLILTIDGDEPNLASMQQFIGNKMQKLKIGETLAYKVLRKDNAGDYKEVELVAKIIQVEQKREHLVSWDQNATEQQLKIRKAWLNQNE